MIDQPPLFDLADGVRRRDAGREQVATGSDREAYMRRAELYLRHDAPDEPFLMEQLYEWIGEPPTPYLMGALTTRLIRGGVIVRTGVRRSMQKGKSHARVTDEYRLAHWVREAR